MGKKLSILSSRASHKHSEELLLRARKILTIKDIKNPIIGENIIYLMVLPDPLKFVFITIILTVLIFVGPAAASIGSCGVSPRFLVDIVSFSLMLLTL